MNRHAMHVILACLTCLLWLLARGACAQDPGLAPELAQVCVSEAGTFSAQWECAAIAETLRNRAERRGQTLRQVMRAHSDRVFDRTRTDRRAWLAWLREDGRKPRHWYAHLPWHGRNRRGWLRLVRHVRYVLEHDVRVCDGKPITWGNAKDRKRYIMQNPRAVEVDCGETKNHFMRPRPEGEM